MTFALVLLGLAVIVGLNQLAHRTAVPVAVLLVLAGLVYAWLPGRNVELQPTVVLEGIIPPLLYAAAVNSSAVGLRRNVRTVASLSVGLVVATTIVVGAIVGAIAPGLPLAAAAALGAAVSPPDPVAALSIGRRAGLPGRLLTIVEGEGLLNDATALTLLQVTVAAAVGGGFSVPATIGRFALALAGGAVVGIVVAVVLSWLRRYVVDPLSDNAISLGTPFAAYLAANSFGGSGVLAVVVAGLWFAHRGPAVQSASSRMQSRAVWSLVEYLMEGFVFLLIGQQLPAVLDGLRSYDDAVIAASVAATVGTVLVLRPVWLLASESLPSRWHTRLGEDAERRHRHLSGAEVAALSWSGTRGVITLAAVSSLPLTVHSGAPFPGRDLLQFCAYLVVLVTLVGQGLTFGPLLRRLHLGSASAGQALLRNQARAAAVRASLERLDDLIGAEDLPDDIVIPLRRAAHHRLERYRHRIERLSDSEDGALPPDDAYFIAARVRRELIRAERAELLRWRDSGRLPDASLRVLQRELDHEEGLLPRG